MFAEVERNEETTLTPRRSSVIKKSEVTSSATRRSRVRFVPRLAIFDYRRGSEIKTFSSASNSSTHLPEPSTTARSGRSAMWIGILVSCRNLSSRPFRSAPPPVNTMPRSKRSAASSGGVLSRVPFTALTIAATGSSSALRISSEETTIVFGRPEQYRVHEFRHQVHREVDKQSQSPF